MSVGNVHTLRRKETGPLAGGPAFTAEQITQTRARALRHHEVNPEISKTKTAKFIGISPGTYIDWLNDKYTGDNSAVTRLVMLHLDLADRRAAAQGEFDHVQTTVDTRIVGAIETAEVARKIALIETDSGVGSTESLLHYYVTHNCALVACNPTNQNPWPLMMALQQAVLGPTVHLRPPDAFVACVSSLRTRSRVILIDEAHYLKNPECFDLLRRLSDEGGVGLVIVHNTEVYQGRGGASLLRSVVGYTQFQRRVVARLRIRAKSITEHDIRLVLGQVLEAEVFSEAIEFLVQEAHTKGGIGRCTSLVQQARMLAGRRTLEAKHIFRVVENESELED